MKERGLAAAVVARALEDVSHPTGVPMAEAVDAVDFLLRRLWRPHDLWGQLVADALPRSLVRRATLAAMSADVRAAIVTDRNPKRRKLLMVASPTRPAQPERAAIRPDIHRRVMDILRRIEARERSLPGSRMEGHHA